MVSEDSNVVAEDVGSPVADSKLKNMFFIVENGGEKPLGMEGPLRIMTHIYTYSLVSRMSEPSTVATQIYPCFSYPTSPISSSSLDKKASLTGKRPESKGMPSDSK